LNYGGGKRWILGGGGLLKLAEGWLN